MSYNINYIVDNTDDEEIADSVYSGFFAHDFPEDFKRAGLVDTRIRLVYSPCDRSIVTRWPAPFVQYFIEQ